MQSTTLLSQTTMNEKYKTRKDDILTFSSVCPSTEYTMKKLKTKRISNLEFETITKLTDEMLYIHHILDNRHDMDVPDSVLNNRQYISKIEKRLQVLLAKHTDLPDKSYPFRHTIMINDTYDKIDKDWVYKTKAFLSKKAKTMSKKARTLFCK